MTSVPFADIPFHERLDWTHEHMAQWSRQMAIACAKAREPLTDAIFNLTPPGKTPPEAFLRASDPSWWRRQGTRKLRIAQEVEELKKGVVGSGCEAQYAGLKAQEWSAHKKKATADFLEHGVIYDPSGADPVPLWMLAKTPAMLAARYYSFLKGIELLADERNLRWAMLTITLPSAWHPHPKNKAQALKSGKTANHYWNERSADEGHKMIGQGWHRIRMSLRKHALHMTGVRAEEPMKDSTPHWHCAFFFRTQEDLDRVCTAVLRQFPAGLRVRQGTPTKSGKPRFSAVQYASLSDFELGQQQNIERGAQCQIDIGARKTGDAQADKQISCFASYILKYVGKSCGVYFGRGAVKQDKSSIIESGPAAKVKQHRETYGIRGIEFYGIPKGAATCWDLLRQVDLKDKRNPPEPFIQHLAKICQEDKGQGFTQYLRLLGGLAICPVTPVYAVKLVKVETQTRYQGKGSRSVGVQVMEVATGRREVHITHAGGRAIMRDIAAEALGKTEKRGGFDVLEVVLDAKKTAEGGLVQIGVVETSN